MAAPRLITLDNVSEQLPLWQPADASHLHAVVDMGSNGIRFSITSLAPPAPRLLLPVYSARAAISLFDALTPSPSGLLFPPATIDAVAAALSRFHRLAIMHAVPPSNIMVLATEAMRRAANAAEMLDTIAKATGGLQVHVLDPTAETLLGAVMGSRSDLVAVEGGALFLDLGGGSMQMTWVDTSKDRYEMDAAKAGESLPYGAARLTRVLKEQPPEVHQAELGALGQGVQRIYATLCDQFPALAAIRAAHQRGEGAVVDVYMCGGGFRGYGSMLMHSDAISPYPISSVNTYSVSARVFCQTGEMRRLNKEYDGKIFGMSKRRRRQFPAIAAVIEAFIAAVPNIGRVTFCGGSNRQGLLMMKLPRDIRESNPLDSLARIAPEEKPVADAVLALLASSLPESLTRGIPTVFSLGLESVLFRSIWHRCGYESDANASFALHDAVTRDPGCPGMTHLARAVLGVAVCARWGGGIGPADERLYKGLRRIADGHAEGASFWATYLGAVGALVAAVLPVVPRSPVEVLGRIRIATTMEPGKEGKRNKVTLKMGLAPEYLSIVTTDDLADEFQSAMSDKGDREAFKTSVQITILS